MSSLHRTWRRGNTHRRAYANVQRQRVQRGPVDLQHIAQIVAQLTAKDQRAA